MARTMVTLTEIVRRESQVGHQHVNLKGNVKSLKQRRGTAGKTSARKAHIQAESASASPFLVSPILPTPAKFVATCEQMPRFVDVAPASAMRFEAVSQDTRSDIHSVFQVWHDLTSE